jgi:hypothetical protein
MILIVVLTDLRVAKMSWDKELPYRYWAPYIDSHPEEFTLLFEHSNYQLWGYKPMK